MSLITIIIWLFIALATVVLLLVGTVIGFGTGMITAVMNYVRAIVSETHLMEIHWIDDDEPAKRSYFFGPGYIQMARTIGTMFQLNGESIGSIFDFAEPMKDFDGNLSVALTVGASVFQMVAFLTTYSVSAIVGGIMFLIHGLIITAVLIAVFLFFSVVWIAERIYLGVKQLFSDCPMCHTRELIPYFKCPECKRIHKKLIPGPYGIWFHRCLCGHRVPSTLLTGRGRLESLCKECSNPLIASNVRPLSFQLVGETYSGKTVYLAAFYHEYIWALTEKGVKTEIPAAYRIYFQNLERWFSGAPCPVTTDFNSQIYPLLIDCGLNPRRQFSVYDIAGESYTRTLDTLEHEQKQLHYCNGILFLLDPTKSVKVNPKAASGSIADIERMVENFVNYLISTSDRNASARFKTPLSVVITKADVGMVFSAINDDVVIREFNEHQDRHQTLEKARDTLCEQFLKEIGYVAVIKMLKSAFESVHFFAVSAMGHNENGSSYTPFGVMAPLEWMIARADKQYAQTVSLSGTQQQIKEK